MERCLCKEPSIVEPFIHSTNTNTIFQTVLESVSTQLLVKLRNMVAESDVTISKTEKAKPKFPAD